MNRDSSILVVLYDCEIFESNTINSIRNFKYKNTKLIIWNNGPKFLNEYNPGDFIGCGLDVEIKETIYNESLAVIYNDFILNNHSDRYIILDHDSKISFPYINEALKINKYNFGIPHIYSLGKPRSPIVNKTPLLCKDAELKRNDEIVGIGSGIIIGSEVVEKIKSVYGNVFDERFYLYGVDTTFFKRINNVLPNDYIKIINGFEHSLSRLELESEVLTKFRKKERSYDKGLTLRYYYPPIKQIYIVLRITITAIIKKAMNINNSLNYYSFIKSYITGKHYRDES